MLFRRWAGGGVEVPFEFALDGVYAEDGEILNCFSAGDDAGEGGGFALAGDHDGDEAGGVDEGEGHGDSFHRGLYIVEMGVGGDDIAADEAGGFV